MISFIRIHTAGTAIIRRYMRLALQFDADQFPYNIFHKHKVRESPDRNQWGIYMSTFSLKIENSFRPAAASAGALPSHHHQLAGLLAQAMALVEQNDHSAMDVIREASALVGGSGLPERSASSTRGGLAPWQVGQVKRHIEKGLARRININELAQATRLSTSYFSAAFRASFGTSPHDYISRQRVDYAKQLMLNGDTPLSEIALHCGFADQSHLCRVFRRVTAQTPAAWRRNRRIA